MFRLGVNIYRVPRALAPVVRMLTRGPAFTRRRRMAAFLITTFGELT